MMMMVVWITSRQQTCPLYIVFYNEIRRQHIEGASGCSAFLLRNGKYLCVCLYISSVYQPIKTLWLNPLPSLIFSLPDVSFLLLLAIFSVSSFGSITTRAENEFHSYRESTLRGMTTGRERAAEFNPTD